MSGVFGIVSPDNCKHDLLFGVDYHSHMGKKYGGLCIYSLKGEWKRANHSIQEAQFQSKFSRYLTDDSWIGKMGIGVISDFDVQPLVLSTRFGTIAIAFSGWIQNLHKLVEKYIANGHSFIVMGQDPDVEKERIYSVSLLATLINEAKTLEAGIQHVWDIIEGSASILILTPDGIIAARDRYGRTPLQIAYSQNSRNRIVTSEDHFLFNLGYEVEKSLNPGEIVHIGFDGIQDICTGDRELSQLCAFLGIYTSNPATERVSPLRLMSGELLAKRSMGLKADFGFGIPDSGIFHGQGFCSAIPKIPYIQGIIKYTESWGRSYTPSLQAIRDLVAKYKLLPITELLRDRNILMTDDSIVRGTQLGDLIWVLLELLGVVNIHLSIACPPLLFPCDYLFSTRRRGELVARRVIGDDVADLAPYLNPDSSQFKEMIRGIQTLMLRGEKGGDRWNIPERKINELLDRFTLQYQRPQDMIEAITTISGLPQKHLCFDCWFPHGYLNG